MVGFEGFVMEDGSPIYQQIVLYLKRGMAGGTIADGDELPSRRVLSALLGVNPNTIQKAYRILEDEELISSRSGAKSCVSLTPETAAGLRRELLLENVRELVSAMKQTGASKEDALKTIETMWEETQ